MTVRHDLPRPTGPKPDPPKPRDPDAWRRGGKAAQSVGRRIEETVEWSCVHYLTAGLAWVRKTEPPTGVDRTGRRFFRGWAPPDYMGFLAGGGRGVCFDLKTTQGDAFEWKVWTGRDPREAYRHRRTKERQIEDLEVAGRMGAVAGVLVVLRSSSPDPAALWVEWRGARGLAEGGSWTAEAIAGLLPSTPAAWPAGSLLDWLPAAVEADRKAGGR